MIDDEYEIYGQRLAADGNELGTKGFRISNVGPAGDIDHEASTVNVVYNSSANEYLVSWSANDLLTDYEVYGQRLTAAGAEIGPDDFRISDMGPDGDDLYAASNPQIAYNSTDNEYFLVWDGDDQDLTLVDNEFEIFGQRVEADGTETGANDFRISDMGGDDTFAAFDARAAYNSSANEFLVVWIAKLWPTQEFEVMGQRVDASTADLLGENFRISDMGPDGNLVAYAFQPDVAYNATDNQYLVVWSGFDLPTSELEIYGQRLDASGAEIGVNDFRISDMGPNGAPMHSALEPTVVHNSVDNEYLVVWYGDDAVDNEAEIYGQRLDANGAEIGANDMRLTHMGPDDDTSYAALLPELAFNPDANQYLLVWVGNDSLPAEFEVYGRLLDHTATPLGPGHLRLSSMGPDGDANFQVFNFQTVYNSVTQEYVVVWDGDDSVDNFIEIFGQRLTASGEEIGPDDFTISAASPGNIGFFRTDYPKVTVSPHSGEALVSFRASLLSSPDDMEIFVQRLDLSGGLLGEAVQLSEMGPPGDGTFFALNNALAYNPQDDLILGTWTGVDDRSPMVNTDMEIFGQLYAIRVDLGLNGVIPAFVSPEVDVTVPLTVTNSGPDTALGLSLTVSLPPGVTFMSASGPGWTCGEAGGIVTCEADSLDVNTSAPLSLTVTSPASFGSFSIPVAITSGNTDLEQGDNSLLLTSQVTPGGQANHPLYLPITLRP